MNLIERKERNVSLHYCFKLITLLTKDYWECKQVNVVGFSSLTNGSKKFMNTQKNIQLMAESRFRVADCNNSPPPTLNATQSPLAKKPEETFWSVVERLPAIKRSLDYRSLNPSEGRQRRICRPLAGIFTQI
jgi:hypothetical protein